MSSVTLIHPEEEWKVLVLHVVTKCTLFQNHVLLATGRYKIRSSVPLDVFQQFVLALNGASVTITEANLSGLFLLSEEFGFEALYLQLLEFKGSTKQRRKENTEICERLAALEERATTFGEQSQQQEHGIEMLQSAFARFTAKCEWKSLDSVILLDFPKIFSPFRGKHFTILWRGSRDGFKVKEFHRRCDGHPNTLVVILDTKGNIFGGFTAVEWKSLASAPKQENDTPRLTVDHSLRSFLFTLKNPHNIWPRRFALKTEKKDQAIVYCSGYGPCFGCHFADLLLHDDCDAKLCSRTSLGLTYTNDTGLDGSIVFADSQAFQVKEIEVFKITDETARQTKRDHMRLRNDQKSKTITMIAI
jgi:lambda repressor-like predicted transcriptional regulator